MGEPQSARRIQRRVLYMGLSSNLFSMKKVEAIFRESKLAGVRDALIKLGVGDISVEPRSPKVKIGVIVADEIAPRVVSTIESAARA